MAVTKTRRAPASKPALPPPKKRQQPKVMRRTVTPAPDKPADKPADKQANKPANKPAGDTALPAKRVLATGNDQPTDKSPKRMRWCDLIEARTLLNGVEEDKHRIGQRRKQIDFGKNTVAYDKFSKACPRHLRTKGDPMTPLIHQKCSKRSFVGQINSWKRGVYAYAAKLENPDDAISNEEMAKILSQTIKPLTDNQKKQKKIEDKRPTRKRAAKAAASKKAMDPKQTDAHQSSSEDDSDYKGGSSPDGSSEDEDESQSGGEASEMEVDVYGNAGDLNDIKLDDLGNAL